MPQKFLGCLRNPAIFSIGIADVLLAISVFLSTTDSIFFRTIFLTSTVSTTDSITSGTWPSPSYSEVAVMVARSFFSPSSSATESASPWTASKITTSIPFFKQSLAISLPITPAPTMPIDVIGFGVSSRSTSPGCFLFLSTKKK